MNSRFLFNQSPGRLWRTAIAALVGFVLNVSAAAVWKQGDGFRWRALEKCGDGRAGFELVPPTVSGISFTNYLDEIQGATNRVLFNGSGVATGDFDGDGLPDIYLARLNGTNALYRNLGNWHFEDVTTAVQLGRPSQLDRGAVFADVSGDGRLDLLIATTGRGVLCFLNGPDGKFRDVTDRVGTRNSYGATSIAVADVDGDRFLDVYVANYRTFDFKDRPRDFEMHIQAGRPVMPPELADQLIYENGQLLQYGEPDILFQNDRHGRFLPVAWSEGAFLDENGVPLRSPPRDWGLTATFRDLNGDSFPDLYVCNDFWTPDRIWLGNGRGQFRALASTAIRSISGSSMGVDIADVDRDGHVDIVVLEMLSRDSARRKRQMAQQEPAASIPGQFENRPQVLRNTFFRGRGDGTFAEIARLAGIDATEWSWSPLFLDVDLDGYEDLLVTAGHIRDILDADAVERVRADAAAGAGRGDGSAALAKRLQHDRWFPKLDFPLQLFRNGGDLHFQDATPDWGTAEVGIHHAIATADFDGDGDQDLVITQLNGPTRLYRNRGSAPRVAVRLAGRKPNVQGIGAKLRVFGGAVPMQSTEIICGGRYMSGSDPEVTFAAGTSPATMTLEVEWRSGLKSRIVDVAPGRLYEITEPAAGSVPNPESRRIAPLFRDISQSLAHVHHEDAFDDMELQPLLPGKLSQWGPGVSWHDINGDGFEDLAIGAGKGGAVGVYINNGHGGFVKASPETQVLPTDFAGAVGWVDEKHSPGWLFGVDNYENAATSKSGLAYIGMTNATLALNEVQLESSVGPLALGDMDGDGVCELFVGGRVRPGRYPEATDSKIFRRIDGRWQSVEAKPLLGVGLINGAVWSDLDGDGFPELLLACEWGSVRVFHWSHGQLTETTRDWGLDRWTGLWTGITTGDFNGDGKLDIVVGNRGWNTGMNASEMHPAELWYGSFSGNAGLDLIETEWDAVRGQIVPRRRLNELSAGFPWLLERFSNHQTYAVAGIESVLAGHQKEAHSVKINTLSIQVLLQRDHGFEPAKLPIESQFAPVFGVNVGDADGDGNEDIFLAQNFFATRAGISRHDAGTGLWLLGNGRGEFRSLSPAESGVAVHGEQRGSALSDFNGDGRIDLIVTQNGAPTRLFVNEGAKPGLRVRLIGPIGNPTAAGAMIRLHWGQRVGPAREIHAGSGHGSEDGAVAVLGYSDRPTSVWVRWPGGRTSETAIPAAGNDLLLRMPQ